MKGYQGIVLGCLLLPISAMAQVPVMEGGSSNNAGRANQAQVQSLPDTQSSSAGLSIEGQLLQQLYQMQQEVSMLRGLLEEQEYKLKKLEQDQLDRYEDLDRRLSNISSGASAPSGASGSENSVSLPPIEPTPSNGEQAVADPAREKLLYEAAFDQVKARNFEKAEMAFSAFLRRYPQSDYAGNAQYWLGEVYLVQGNLDAAGKAFAKVLSQYSQHRKGPDALYKLAEVEQRLGNAQKATELYQEVLKNHPDAAAAQLARRALDNMR